MTRPIVILGSSKSDGETRRAVDMAFEGRADCLDLQNYDFGPYDYNNANKGDDFGKVIDAVLPRDTVVFATPVYWYSMSARLKTFLDRLSDLITIEKTKGRALAGKTAWLLVTGTDERLPEGFEVPFARTCAYFDIRYQRAGYLYTGANPQLRGASEAGIKEFGNIVTGSTQEKGVRS